MKRIGLWLEFIVQFFWIVFLIVLVWRFGTAPLAAKFLNPRYYWLLYLSIVFFTAFLFNTMIKLLSEQTNEGSPSVYIYLLIPILLLPVALKAELGSKVVERRDVVFVEVEEDETTEADSSESEPYFEVKNPDGSDRYSEILTNPEKNIGRNVDLIGRAAFNPVLPDDSFYIFRFIIFCCVADATPGGFIVTGIDASNIIEDQWYHVKGTISMIEVDGDDYISVEAVSIESTKQPDFPYEDFYLMNNDVVQ